MLKTNLNYLQFGPTCFPFIFMDGQELRLQEKQLSLLSEIAFQYVAQSGMEKAVCSGVISGRAHGGVSIAWSANLNNIMRPLINYKHKRLVCVEMQSEPKPIIFISIYMPFYDSGKRAECISETVNVRAMVEEIVAYHPLHSIVISGDFNTVVDVILPVKGAIALRKKS